MFRLKTSAATSVVALSATPALLLGTNPGRLAVLLPTPPAGDTISISPRKDLTANALFGLSQYTGLHRLLYRDLGEMVQLEWYAIASASITVEVTEVQADPQELQWFIAQLRRFGHAHF